MTAHSRINLRTAISILLSIATGLAAAAVVIVRNAITVGRLRSRRYVAPRVSTTLCLPILIAACSVISKGAAAADRATLSSSAQAESTCSTAGSAASPGGLENVRLQATGKDRGGSTMRT